MNDFIRRFEAGTLTEKERTHAAHLPGGKNTESSGYHETLTEVWIREVRAHGPENVEQLPSDLWKRDYSIDLPKNRRARRVYLRPGEA